MDRAFEDAGAERWSVLPRCQKKNAFRSGVYEIPKVSLLLQVNNFLAQTLTFPLKGSEALSRSQRSIIMTWGRMMSGRRTSSWSISMAQ